MRSTPLGEDLTQQTFLRASPCSSVHLRVMLLLMLGITRKGSYRAREVETGYASITDVTNQKRSIKK